MATDKTRSKIVDALLRLLGERDFAAIGLGDVAKAADVPLGALREAFEGQLAILAEFGRQIDRAVLADGASGEATARERLFEVMMRRFDALRPYRAGVRGLARSARRDPMLAAALCRNAQVSAKWMLVAADVPHRGLAGAVAIGGAAMIYAGTLGVFVEDEDAGLDRTMAALDRALERGERTMQFLDRACALVPRLAERGRDRSGADAAG